MTKSIHEYLIDGYNYTKKEYYFESGAATLRIEGKLLSEQNMKWRHFLLPIKDKEI